MLLLFAGDGRAQSVHDGAGMSCWLERTLDRLQLCNGKCSITVNMLMRLLLYVCDKVTMCGTDRVCIQTTCVLRHLCYGHSSSRGTMAKVGLLVFACFCLSVSSARHLDGAVANFLSTHYTADPCIRYRSVFHTCDVCSY